MGILDSKNRVMDTIITLAGRRQIASGELVIKYATFTDADTFYEADLISGTTDATRRVYLEACHLPQDNITFESDDSGKLSPFKSHNGLGLLHGKILSGSISGSKYLSVVNEKGPDFETYAHRMLSSSIENFSRLYSIGTRNSIFDDDDFKVTHKNINFHITDDKPFGDHYPSTANINHVERFMEDSRLSHAPNFKYLPPANKVHDKKVSLRDPNHYKKYKLGHFPHMHWQKKLSYKQIDKQSKKAAKMGFSQTIKFDPTSHKNELFAQFFEVHSDTMVKLDVIDFGRHVFRDEENETKLPKHVFFVGKVLVDDHDTHKFVHMFTLIFE